MTGKTVVITGISGHFGQVLLPHLDADPDIERIIGIDRASFGDQTSSKKLVFHQVDLRSSGWESLLPDADVLVHLAFILMRSPGARDVDEINEKTTRQVFEAAARQGVRKLVVTSSVVAYGLHPDNPIPLTEESPLRPNAGNYYSRAKAANEKYLDQFEKQHPDMIVTRLRPCTVVGLHAPPANMASLTGKTGILVSGSNPPIQLVHEEDMATALHLAIKKDLPGIFNVTSDEPRTLEELMHLRGGNTLSLPYSLARAAMWLTWRLGLSVFAPEWADLSRYPLVASNEKLKAMGWTPHYTTAKAFSDLLSGLNRERQFSDANHQNPNQPE